MTPPPPPLSYPLYAPVSSARVHQAALGGQDFYDSYEADEDVVRRLTDIGYPARAAARAGRAFHLRAVTYATETLGLHQVLDIGPGLPPHTGVDTHSIAALYTGDRARTLYADADPIVVARWDPWLRGHHVRAAQIDLRRTETLLAEADAHFDLRYPVVVVATAVLDTIDDQDQPHACMRRIRDALVPGSVLVLSHLTYEDNPPLVHQAETVLRKAGLTSCARGFEDIAAFFGDLTAVGPGLVPVSQWYPTGADPDDTSTVHTYGGVGIT
ncbi:SAM-dependent methyltransferase [Streptomyces tsukubensis]